MPSSLFLAMCLAFGGTALQSGAPQPDLGALIQNLPAAANANDPVATQALPEALANTSIDNVKANLPTLITATESTDERMRFVATWSLIGLEGVKDNTSQQIDTAKLSLLIPYVSRLGPRLFDPATASVTALLFNALAFVKPASPELSTVLIQSLADPRSTKPLPANPGGAAPREAIYTGPLIVDVLINADATFYLDPKTKITEGTNSSDVQQAIIDFLHRPDQTSASTAQSIRGIALAQPQNPRVNDDLVRFLSSSDPTVQASIVYHLTRLTFSPEGFSAAQTELNRIASDSSTPPELRTTANAIVPCWNNNRHVSCP